MSTRVVFFQHAAVIGGASWCLLEMVRGLDPGQFDCHVVMRERGPLEEALAGLGCAVHHEPRFTVQMPSHDAYFDRKDWPARLPYILLREWVGVRRTAAAAFEWCRQLRPDVVHINTIALFPAAGGARRAGVKRVILHNREHWRDYAWHPPRTRIKNRRVARDVGRILSITRTGEQCFGSFGRTGIVHDWPSFDPRGRDRHMREELGLARDAFVVLVPGGLASYKGSRIAMEAWNHVRAEAAVLVLLGYAPEGFSGRGISADLARIRGGRRDSVRCLPRTIDMKSLMQQSGAVVSPFLVPHASKAVLDAASLGVPSIVADCGEAREYVEDEGTGIITAPGDAAALARAIERLVRDRARGTTMGERAREKIAREFDVRDSMRQICAAYG